MKRHVSIVAIIIALASIGCQETERESITQNISISLTETEMQQKEAIDRVIKHELQGWNNRQRPYLRNLTIRKDEKGFWDVLVEFNADSNLVKGWTRDGIEEKIAEIYITLYSIPRNIDYTTVNAYMPLVDRYGNTSDGLVYRAVLWSEEARKVNWAKDETALKMQILPNVWNTVIVHPDFR